MARAIIRNLIRETIHWPLIGELEEVATAYNDQGALPFPHIIGCIDGCHIRISTPRQNPDDYFNRKKFHSVVLQAVCREDLRFTDVSVGCPGRMHDSRVLRSSRLWLTGYHKCGYGQWHIIADSAYPIQHWILTPYRNTGQMTQAEKDYNRALSTKRQNIERAFGLLKRRFPKLRLEIEVVSTDEIEEIILSACILHNLLIMYDDTGVPDDVNMQRVDQEEVGNDDEEQEEQMAEDIQALLGRQKRVNITQHIAQHRN